MLLNNTEITDPIIDETIDDVSKNVWQLAITKFRSKSILVAIGTIVLMLAILLVAWYGYSSAINFLVYALAIPVIYFAYLNKQLEHALIKQFALRNGFSYTTKGTLENKNGYIFSLGHNQSVTDDVKGTYQNCPIELFNFQYESGYGESQAQLGHTVFSIDFMTLVPHIILRKHNPLYLGGHGVVKLTLEGDFSDKFDLFTEKGFELETMQLFTPDFMKKLEDEWKFELEFIGTKLYLYSAGLITKRVDLINLYETVKYLISKLDPIILGMKSDVTAVLQHGAKRY